MQRLSLSRGSIQQQDPKANEETWSNLRQVQITEEATQETRSMCSYGMNTEKFVKIKFCEESQTHTSIISDRYLGGNKINDDTWFIEKQSKYFNCNTPIQESIFTRDNAKFRYLTFIYKFMYKCLDRTWFHFTSGDSDSIYIAFAGTPSRDSTQGFEAIVIDKEFYDKWIYTFMPDPSINTFEDMKKAIR